MFAYTQQNFDFLLSDKNLILRLHDLTFFYKILVFSFKTYLS